jgi:YVTN family beta-propeller protein
VEVIDTLTETVVGKIADTQGVHGIAVAPELGRAFVSDGRANQVSIVDTSTLSTLLKVETGTNPDAILYNPAHREVYAFNGRSASVTVINAEKGQAVSTVALGGKPEFAQVDPVADRIFDNLEDKNEVVVIDGASHAVLARWPIAPGESASGMAIDTGHHRLFLGCENEMMVVVDSESGKVVANLPAGKGIDAAAFDPGTQLAFTSNGRNGTVTIVHEDTPDTYAVVQTLVTERGARTMTVDTSTHRIYLATAKFGPSPAGGGRPPIIPGSFKVLVYGIGP